MRTQKQIEASRINGAKSPGRKPGTTKKPVDTAITDDLLARGVMLPGESRKSLDFLHETLTKELMPNGPIEELLVAKMTVAHWCQLRLWGAEKANHKHREMYSSIADPATRRAKVLTDQATAASIFARYDSNCDRQFSRALDRFIRIFAARAAAAENSTDTTPET